MFLRRLKNCMRTLAALLAAAVALFFVWSMGAVRLFATQGKRTFYLSSPSSQAKQTDRLSFLELTGAQGESVRFIGDEKELPALLTAYGAEIVFTEEACGVRSYYCFARSLGKGISLNGEYVNLHIAFSKAECVVGTPIIFGGF